MKPLGPAIDPSPHRDLPSDVRFTLWLRTLQPWVVMRDLEAGLFRNSTERLYLAAAHGHKKRSRLH